MNQERNWTVLCLGGASGMGKTCVAQALARTYGVNMMEVDDIHQAVKAISNKALLPMVHYWETGMNWMEVGVAGNVKWLTEVSLELIPAIRSVVDNHLDGNVPLILEGDFLHPALLASFQDPWVRTLIVHEPDEEQIVHNYLAREGGERQAFRASVSSAYGAWLSEEGNRLGIPVVEARPWETAVDRIHHLLYDPGV